MVRVLEDARREASTTVAAAEHGLAEVQAIVRVPYASSDAWRGQSVAAQEAALAEHPQVVLQHDVDAEQIRMGIERRMRRGQSGTSRS